jgi:hypothetical protein
MSNATKGRKSSSSVSISFERIQVSRKGGTSHQSVGDPFAVGSRRIWTIGLSSSGVSGLVAFGLLNLIAHLISRFSR